MLHSLDPVETDVIIIFLLNESYFLRSLRCLKTYDTLHTEHRTDLKIQYFMGLLLKCDKMAKYVSVSCMKFGVHVYHVKMCKKVTWSQTPNPIGSQPF